MTSGPALARARLEEIPAGTELLRQVRFLHAADFAECTDDDLALAARWLKAAAYSAAEGARRIELILRTRHTEQDPECISDPPTTPTPATATTRPRSPSNRKTTGPA